jgi:hydrogenase maturation protease
MQDDGFGPSAVRRLEAGWTFGDEVELLDLGTPGLDLPSKILDLQLLVFLDVVKSTAPPGTLCAFDKEELLEKAPVGRRQTTHEAGIREALWTADLLGRGPKAAFLVGVVPKLVDSGTGLSPEVEGAMDATLGRVIETLAGHGYEATPRAVPAATGAWWE